MRIREGSDSMWLVVTNNIHVPFTKVWSTFSGHVVLYDGGVLTCYLWYEDARTFNMLYKEFTSRTNGEQ